MAIVIRILVGLFGLLFVANGLRWIIQPAQMAEALGMPLLTGIAASTQIGDLGSFFLVIGVLTLAGILPGRTIALYPPLFFIAIAAFYRSVAAFIGYAAWAPSFIVFELVMVALLWLAIYFLPRLDP